MEALKKILDAVSTTKMKPAKAAVANLPQNANGRKDIGRRNRRRRRSIPNPKQRRSAPSGVQQNGRHPTGHSHPLASLATARAIRSE
jgi:hypothetical protein